MELFLRPLTLQEGKTVFDTHMTRDFPESELKPWPLMEALAQQGEYHMLGAFHGENLVGYAWQYCPPQGEAVLLDYLAVLPRYRSQGLGEGILALLRRHYDRAILLESEEPSEAPDGAIAQRRLGFYSRCGMLPTGVQLRLFGVRFCILASRPMESVQKALQDIYDGLLGPSLAQSAVEYL